MIFSLILSGLLGIISYFLTQTMIKINKNIEVTNKNTTDIALLEQDHKIKYDYLSSDLKEFKEAIKDLTKEIKELNTKFSERGQ